MFHARVTPIEVENPIVPGDDRPVIRYPNPQIRRFTDGDRTVLQLALPADAVAEFDTLGGTIELQIVAEDEDG